MFHREEWIPAVQIRNERRSQFGFALLAVLVTIALAVGVVSCAQGADREATCWLGGFSGVCVDAAGLVLTAKHCDFGDQVDVEFRAIGKTFTGRKVYTGSFDDDDVVAFQLPPGSYPAAAVAASAPARGEIVYTFGYPSGKFEALTGTVIGLAKYDDGTPIIATTIPARGGHSGGPLFNLQGEVVGLCSTSLTARAPQRVEIPGDSNWIGTDRLQAALAFVQQGPKAPPPATPRRLYVFTAVWCGSCQTFASDYARNIDGMQDWLHAQGLERTKGGKHYGAVENVAVGWDRPEIARACEVATGQRPKLLPTFWVDGAKDVLVGYAGPQKLKAYVAAQLAAAPPPQPTPAPVPEPEPFQRQAEPTPVPDPRLTDPPGPEAPDVATWSDVKVIVMVAQQDRGVAYGAGARLALEQASGAIRRRVQEATQRRADVELVTERLSPERFAAVAAAAGLSVDKLHVVVLVRRQDLGALRAKAVELIERAVTELTERSSRVPIDFVSERLNPELHSAITAALNAPDTANVEASASSWWMSAIAAFVGLLKRRFLNAKEAA